MQQVVAKNGIVTDEGKIFLVETIPYGLEFDSFTPLPLLWENLWNLINKSTRIIQMASSYFAFLNTESAPTEIAEPGQKIYNALVSAAKRGVEIQLCITAKSPMLNQEGAVNFAKECPEKIKLGFLDVAKISSYHDGIQHSKFSVFDEKDFYFGSANSDWKAMTQVAEIGVIGLNCQQTCSDLLKIFKMFWYCSFEGNPLPNKWSDEFSTIINHSNPIKYLGSGQKAFFSVSPKEFVGCGRDPDHEALLRIINETQCGTIQICAMEMSFWFLFTKDLNSWVEIDLALRNAASKRNVAIRVMADGRHSRNPKIRVMLDSLNSYSSIVSKWIDVPPEKLDFPFTRLFHSKLVIGQHGAWIGTNNISPDYFLYTAGVGFNIVCDTPEGISMKKELETYFDRYFYSKYAHSTIGHHFGQPHEHQDVGDAKSK